VFILYNCARIAAILRQFEEKVQLGYYPQLIPYEEVDFLLLSKEVSYLSFLDCVESVAKTYTSMFECWLLLKAIFSEKAFIFIVMDISE
jgi:hypothetical protein